MIMDEINSVEKRIFEKLRERTTNDFRNIPENKRTDFDNSAIKLVDAFEFITVPATKKERNIKTFFLNKYTVEQKFVEITRSLDEETDRNVIVFRCGDTTLKIYHNVERGGYFNPRLADAYNDIREHMSFSECNDYLNRKFSGCDEKTLTRNSVSLPPYQSVSTTVVEIYRIIGSGNKTFNKFEEVESYLIDYVVEYTRNFKIKRINTYYH